MKIKKLFATPGKSAVTIACTLAVLTAAGVCTAAAVSAIAESTSIGAENAQNFAFADAGVDPVSAVIEETSFSFQQGQFVYEIAFTADGTEYTYWIRASDGSVVKNRLS